MYFLRSKNKEWFVLSLASTPLTYGVVAYKGKEANKAVLIHDPKFTKQNEEQDFSLQTEEFL